MKFTYQNPTLIEFGQNKIAKISELIPQDKKILVVYGGGSIKKNGVYDQVKEALKNHPWCEFSGVQPNPTKEHLDKAIAKARNEKVEFILAVGGGSVVDGCKYIANGFYYEGDGWDLLEGKHQSQKALPIGVILTLAATGSESNTGSVITKEETKEKRFFHSQFSYPQFSVLDPDVLKSLDDRQLVNGIVDAFVHVCEQYITYPQNALVQDGYAEGLLKGLIQLADTYDKRDDDWYANLMFLANQGLSGLIGVGIAQDWGTHFIGHELSGLYGMDHARTLAVIQPNLLRVLKEEKKEKLLQMGENVFKISTSDPEDVIKKIETLYRDLNIDLKLSSYTTDKDLISKVTDLLDQHGFAKFGERGSLNKERVTEILKMSL